MIFSSIELQNYVSLSLRNFEIGEVTRLNNNLENLLNLPKI